MIIFSTALLFLSISELQAPLILELDCHTVWVMVISSSRVREVFVVALKENTVKTSTASQRRYKRKESETNLVLREAEDTPVEGNRKELQHGDLIPADMSKDIPGHDNTRKISTPSSSKIFGSAVYELFIGIHGQGAFLNGKPISASSQTVLVNSLLATEVGTKCDKATVDATTNRIKSLLFKVRSLRMSGSCGLNLCGIAAGRLDLVYEIGFEGPWDVTAGVVIVEDAGGRVFDPLALKQKQPDQRHPNRHIKSYSWQVGHGKCSANSLWPSLWSKEV